MEPSQKPLFVTFKRRTDCRSLAPLMPPLRKALRAVGAGAPPIAGRKTSGNPQPLSADFRKQLPAYYKWVQESLNKILGLSLVTDGAAGTATKAAIRDFQKKVGIAVTGAVDCNTEGKLIENNGCRMPHPARGYAASGIGTGLLQLQDDSTAQTVRPL